MKKLLSAILALTLILCAMPAALAAEEETTVPTVTVSTLTQPIYEDAKDFSDGLAPVKMNGKWGYIDETGKTVIDFKYDFAGSFSEGVALVAKIETQEVYSFDHGVHSFGNLQREDQRGYFFYLVKKDGTETPLICPVFYDGMYDESSTFPREIMNPVYDYMAEDGGMSRNYGNVYFQEGILIIQGMVFNSEGKNILPDFEELQQGVKNIDDWNRDISGVYATGFPCVDGVISMYTEPSLASEDDVTTYFYMDKEGKILKIFDDLNGCIIDGNCLSDLSSPKDGLALAEWVDIDIDEDEYTWNSTERYGMLDENGNWAVAPVYSDFRWYFDGTFFADGLWTVVDESGKFGAVDKTGAVKIPLEYDFLTSYNSGLAGASKDGKFFYIDTHNNKYAVALPGGGIATDVILGSHFSDHVAAVYDRATNKAFCILDTPVKIDGQDVLPAVEGSENIALSVYFPDYTGDVTKVGTIAGVGDIVTYEKDGKYGFYKLNFDIDENVNPYDDMLPGDWYFYPVMWAAQNDIVDHEPGSSFAPGSKPTRGDIILAIWKAAGSPEPSSTENPFVDVKEGDPYFKAILWAIEKGITNGTDDTHFSPAGQVKRNQIVTFLYRVANTPAPGSSENPFTDVRDSAWYRNAVLWAIENGITDGTSATTFSPENICTKAQLITFIYRQFAE